MAFQALNLTRFFISLPWGKFLEMLVVEGILSHCFCVL